MSPQGHVFKSLTQGPRGQSTYHTDNLSSFATIWALWVIMPRSHRDRMIQAQSLSLNREKVRREEGWEDWDLSESPIPQGTLHSTIACSHDCTHQLLLN